MTALQMLQAILAVVGLLTVVGGPVLFMWFRKEFVVAGQVMTRTQQEEHESARNARIEAIIKNAEAEIRTDLQTAVGTIGLQVARDIERMSTALDKSIVKSEAAYEMGRTALEGVTLAERNVAGLKELFGKEFEHIRVILERNNRHP